MSKKMGQVAVVWYTKSPEEIVEPDVIVEDEYKGWDLEGIATNKEVKAGRLHGKMRALQYKCFSASGGIPAEMVAIVELAERRLGLEGQVAKWEWTLVEVERKLQQCRRIKAL